MSLKIQYNNIYNEYNQIQPPVRNVIFIDKSPARNSIGTLLNVKFYKEVFYKLKK